MRVCLFGPDVEAFAGNRRRQLVPGPPPPGVDEILLTNSRGLPPGDGTHVYVTAGANTLTMRGARWLSTHLRSTTPLRLLSAVVSRLCGDQLLEGLRAADPDVIVSLDRVWAHHLQTCLERYKMPWPCITAGETPPQGGTWRKYDPDATVSIVFPTYNGTTYLAKSLESCLSQTHRRIEVVIVDDGSGPEVLEIVKCFSDARVKYVRHEVNRGLPAALNTGFAHSTGALLTWTSDDNAYAPTAIEEMVRFLCTYPEVDFVYADAYEIDADGNVVGTLHVPPPEWLQVKNRVGGCFLYRRRVYLGVGAYDAKAVLAEDYDYWLRVARRFAMQRLFRILYYYRFHPRSLTGSSERERVRRQAERVKRANRSWWRITRAGGAT
jgi:GT2 family glycosyltransferase